MSKNSLGLKIYYTNINTWSELDFHNCLTPTVWPQQFDPNCLTPTVWPQRFDVSWVLANPVITKETSGNINEAFIADNTQTRSLHAFLAIFETISTLLLLIMY